MREKGPVELTDDYARGTVLLPSTSFSGTVSSFEAKHLITVVFYGIILHIIE